MSRESSLVVHVVPYYPPHLGGLENVASALAEGLAESGRVVVLTSRSGPAPAPRRERRGNLEVKRLFTAEYAHVPFMPSLLPQLLRIPREAVVHVHVAVAYVPEMVWLAGLLKRRPFVAHYHLDVEPSGRFGPVFLAYKRWVLGGVLRGAANVIVLTEDQAAFVRRRYRVDGQRLVIMPNTVAPHFLGDPPTRSEHAGPFRLLFVGRLAVQKNLSLLLRSMREVTQPVELVIVGDGDQRGSLDRLLADLGLPNVRMVGSKTGEELVGWYRWADAFVITSEKEGMPLVLLEAMAAGLPVVGTDVPGIADTVGADGLLAPPDPIAFAAAVDRLAGDPALWDELASRSHRRGRQYGSAAGLEALRRLYEGIPA